MTLLTTCIGAYPKPGYVTLPDWFNIEAGPATADPTRQWPAALAALGPRAEDLIARGVCEVIRDQTAAGIDIPTDGEIARENYIHYHCRHLDGFDFEHLTPSAVRGDGYETALPTITGPVRARDPFLATDWRRASRFTDRPVKITLPGPLTIADTSADAWYDDPVKLGADLGAALNREVLALADAGCRHVQIDEPVFARRPADALRYGFDNLERAFHGCPRQVARTLHVCCGYPDRLDRDDYPKADRAAYFELADAIEHSSIDMVSLEDAHRHNDLMLLERFETTAVILGVVAIASSRVETVDEIAARLQQALGHIDRRRLVAAPDCGLGLLGRELARKKLANLCAAVGALPPAAPRF